jgi:hypothetical protein
LKEKGNEWIKLPEYDVCLSFAGEDRDYVRAVASALKEKGIRVFFDEYEKVGLWGKDLYVHLDDVYKNAARFCIIFISKHYAEKLWTNHERRSAQERSLKENLEYILPARFDDTTIPGIRETIGYIDLRDLNPLAFANLISSKVGKTARYEYIPPIPDVLFEKIGVVEKNDQQLVYDAALQFLRALKRMTQEERSIIFDLFINCCPSELPDNVHINIDYLRRISGLAPSKIKRLLSGLSSLGFNITLRKDEETEDRLGRMELLVLEWQDMSVDGLGNATDIVNALIEGVTERLCEHCGMEALNRLDFSQLANVTATADDHVRKK